MIPVWPAALPQTPTRGGWTGGPRDERIRFEPDRGPAIERRGVTAETGLYQATFSHLTPAMVAEWERFFREDLAAGVRSFAWRDPLTGLAWAWRVAPGQAQAWTITSRGAMLSDLSVQLVRMPGPPWWQPTAPVAGPLALPVLVADFERGVYGADLVREGLAQIFDFARPGPATCMGHTGQIELVAADLPRITHDPLTGERLGLLIESGHTNLIFHSSDTTLWSATEVSQDGTVTAPDGSTVPIWRTNAVSSLHRLTRAGATGERGDRMFAVSVYIHIPAGSDAQRLWLRARHALPAQRGQVLTLSIAGTGDATVLTRVGGSPFGPGAPPASTAWQAVPIGGGWHRIALFGMLAADGAAGTILMDVGFSATATENDLGTAQTRFALWQGQVEPGEAATAPIITGASAVTRGGINLQSRSDLSAGWSVALGASDAELTPAAQMAPDGTMSMATFLCTTTTFGARRIGGPTFALTAGTPYAASLYIRPIGGWEWVNLVLVPSASFFGYILAGRFNLVTGQMSPFAGGQLAMEHLPGGVIRISGVGTPAIAGSYRLYLALNDALEGPGDWVIGVPGAGVAVWGAQVEPDALSSYIPTSTTEVVRAADVIGLRSGLGVADISAVYADGTQQSLPGQALDTGWWLSPQSRPVVARIVGFPA